VPVAVEVEVNSLTVYMPTFFRASLLLNNFSNIGWLGKLEISKFS